MKLTISTLAVVAAILAMASASPISIAEDPSNWSNGFGVDEPEIEGTWAGTRRDVEDPDDNWVNTRRDIHNVAVPIIRRSDSDDNAEQDVEEAEFKLKLAELRAYLAEQVPEDHTALDKAGSAANNAFGQAAATTGSSGQSQH